MIGDALDDMPEDSEAKRARLAGYAEAEAAGVMAEGYAAQKRWIGRFE